MMQQDHMQICKSMIDHGNGNDTKEERFGFTEFYRVFFLIDRLAVSFRLYPHQLTGFYRVSVV